MKLIEDLKKILGEIIALLKESVQINSTIQGFKKQLKKNEKAKQDIIALENEYNQLLEKIKALKYNESNNDTMLKDSKISDSETILIMRVASHYRRLMINVGYIGSSIENLKSPPESTGGKSRKRNKVYTQLKNSIRKVFTFRKKYTKRRKTSKNKRM